MDGYSKEFIAASATPLLLSILASGESYGYEIIQKLSLLSGGKLQWSEGMLYPVLAKLEQKGKVVAEWRKSEQGRERKYYRLSPEGLNLLQAERQNWELITDLLKQIWNPTTSLT
jgi:PadR family transcriptional regulator, regulatory protein PadR